MATPSQVPAWALAKPQSFRQKASPVVRKAAKAMGLNPSRYAEQRSGNLVRVVFWDNRRWGQTVIRR